MEHGSFRLLRKALLSGMALTTVFRSTAFFISIGSIYLATKSRQLRSLTGIDGLIGEIGVVKLTLNPKGLVLVHGEIWNAESDMLINDGENVVVEAVEGLKIKVRKIVE